MIEDAIRQPDLAQNVQRYQLAVDQAEVRLDLAVCPGMLLLLMPMKMIINTKSTVGYKLTQVVRRNETRGQLLSESRHKKAGFQLIKLTRQTTTLQTLFTRWQKLFQRSHQRVSLQSCNKIELTVSQHKENKKSARC